MKLNQWFVLLAVTVLLANCSEEPIGEEKPEPKPEESQESETEVYFTLNTFSNPNLISESEKWIVLHDSNGNLLDYSSYVIGDKLEFKAPKDSISPTISVTYLYYETDNEGRKNHEISTTTNIAKGYVDNFGPYDPSLAIEHVKNGEFVININNISNPLRQAYPLKVELSSGLGRIGVSGSGSADAWGIDLYLKGIEKFENYDDYLITILDHNNTLKYHYFENMTIQDYTVDYQTDFIQFEKDISVSLPSYTSFALNIAGFKEGQEFDRYGGYWLHEVISGLNNDVPTAPLKLGYIDVFPKYRTQFSISMTGYNYSISKYGRPLDVLTIPAKPSFSVTDPSLGTFRFDVDLDYLSVTHHWNYKENSTPNGYTRTNWTVLAEKGFDPKIGNLPEEIIVKYPTINLDLLEYKSSTFSLYLEDSEYLSNQILKIFNE